MVRTPVAISLCDSACELLLFFLPWVSQHHNISAEMIQLTKSTGTHMRNGIPGERTDEMKKERS